MVGARRYDVGVRDEKPTRGGGVWLATRLALGCTLLAIPGQNADPQLLYGG